VVGASPPPAELTGASRDSGVPRWFGQTAPAATLHVSVESTLDLKGYRFGGAPAPIQNFPLENGHVLAQLACDAVVSDFGHLHACQYIYDCTGCGHRMKRIKGKCCVNCSYGSVPCPPIQEERDCCAGSV
jgi:hypothetical protein